jgi:hypothetical protein
MTVRNICDVHRQRMRKHGSYHVNKRPELSQTYEERFLAKTVKTDGCWLWAGAIDSNRLYGHFRYKGRVFKAHRVAYLMWVGPIPDGLELDHTCANHRCVNPAHLEVVTHLENMRRHFARKREKAAAA